MDVNDPRKEELLKLMEQNQFLKPFLGLIYSDDHFYNAIKNGDTDKVKYFMARGCKPDKFNWQVPVACNQLEIAKFFIKKGIMPVYYCQP